MKEEGSSYMEEEEGSYFDSISGSPIEDCFGLHHDPRVIGCQHCIDREECAKVFYRQVPDAIFEDVGVAFIDLQELIREVETGGTEAFEVSEPNLLMEDVTMAQRVQQQGAPIGAVPPAPALADMGITPEALQNKVAEVEASEAEEVQKKKKNRSPVETEKDKFGFTVGSKGNYIAELLSTGQYTKKEILSMTNEKFGTDSSGRVNMVLFSVKKKGFSLVRSEEGKYTLSAA